MENVKTITIQMSEETYQRMKSYLNRHKVKQKDFVIGLMEAAINSADTSAQEAANV